MAVYQNLIDSINAVITDNHNNEITGATLRNLLKSMVSVMGANATYGGVAHIEDNPQTPDGAVIYIASDVGTYPNFGGLTVDTDELAVFVWDTNTWSKESITYIADKSEIEELIQQGIEDINGAKDEAIEEIEQIVQSVDVTYETISGDNVQLKNGGGDLLMPKTNANVVDVPKNATTISLDERLKEMKFVTELNIAGGTKANGYINANGKTWVTSTTAYGRIIDISAYRGMSIMYQRKPASTGRYALLRTYVSTNSANIDYASNAFLRTYNDNNVHVEKIPYDCTFLFCMVYSNSTDITPTVSVYDDSASYNAGIAVGKIIGNFEEKIIKTIYPRQLQPANGYVGTSGTYTLSTTNRGAFINVVDYRGKKINWISPSRGTDWDTRWAFTKTAPTTAQTSSILFYNWHIFRSNT